MPSKLKQLLDFCSKQVIFLSNIQCLLCGDTASGSNLCAVCKERLMSSVVLGCHRCGLPLFQRLDRCDRCSPTWHVSKTYFLGDYDWPFRGWISRLKYHHQLHYGRIMGAWLAEQLQQEGVQVDCLIPMPLHVSRLRSRGFNQASEIAKVLSQSLHIPIAWDIATRIHATPTQTTLKANARRVNLKHAFHVQPLPGKTVAIVDDVLTTGATSQALANALLKAGATEVQLWCLARVL
jgi:ComF family protein